jgi:hypothetical protein
VYIFSVAYSGVEERYLGRLKRAHSIEMYYGNLAKFGETFVPLHNEDMAIPSQA